MCSSTMRAARGERNAGEQHDRRADALQQRRPATSRVSDHRAGQRHEAELGVSLGVALGRRDVTFLK